MTIAISSFKFAVLAGVGIVFASACGDSDEATKSPSTAGGDGGEAGTVEPASTTPTGGSPIGGSAGAPQAGQPGSNDTGGAGAEFAGGFTAALGGTGSGLGGTVGSGAGDTSSGGWHEGGTSNAGQPSNGGTSGGTLENGDSSNGGVGVGGDSGHGQAEAGNGARGGDSTQGQCAVITAAGWRDLTRLSSYGTAGVYDASVTSSQLGAGQSVILLELYQAATGNFRLGAGQDANYESCSRCLTVSTDDDRYFLADAGTLSIDPSSKGLHGLLKSTVANVHFSEVTIDPNTLRSTPVPGGGCISLGSSQIDVVPEVPKGCLEVAASSQWSVNIEDELTLYSAMTEPDQDSIQFTLGVSNNSTGTFTLGQGDEKPFPGCEHCFTAQGSGDTESGRLFFAVDGSIQIDPSSEPVSGVLQATATNVTFAELTEDGDALMPGGQCLHLSSAGISVRSEQPSYTER